MNSNKPSISQTMLFNTVGSLIYYACQWFLSVVIVRISGYEKAGVLSLAMSVTAAPAIIGLFNVRNYQASDLNNQYNQKTYINSRHITNLFSFLICAVMVLAGGYSKEKAVVILLFMLYKIAEGYADVYYGIEQRWERLDYAGISMTIRGIGTIIIFVVILLAFDNLIIGLLAISIFSLLIVLVYDVRKTRAWCNDKIDASQLKSEVISLLITCIPLAIVAFLNNFAFNLAKIVLEGTYGSEVMGYYSSVASPTLVVQLAAQTIFAPMIPPLTECFVKKDKNGFYSILKKFSCLFCGLTIVVLIGSKLLAHWGLCLLFGDKIEPYVYLFVYIVLMTIFMAINTSLFSVCTLIREIKIQYLIGMVAIVVSVITAYTLVVRFSMEGVIWAQTITILSQILIQIVIIVRKLRKHFQ